MKTYVGVNYKSLIMLYRLTQVGREGKELLTDQHVHSVNGGVAENFVVIDSMALGFIWDVKVLASLGDINLIALHGCMVAVMTVVGDFPAEIRSPEERMGDLEYKIRLTDIGVRHGFRRTNPITSLTILWSEKAPCPHYGDVREILTDELLDKPHVQ